MDGQGQVTKVKKFSVKFDKDVYSAQAVKNAAYDFTGVLSLRIQCTDTSTFVEAELKDAASDIKSVKLDFINCVLDHQVRLDVSKEFKIIRETIIATPFEPCENLKKIIEALKKNNKI